jgi:zinc transporter ZupT
MDPELLVLLLASLTALTTGLGAVPFAFFPRMSPTVEAQANALAAGLMLGASFGLATEGTTRGGWETLAGAAAGVFFILAVHRLLDRQRFDFWGTGPSVGAKRALLVLVVMTAHSAAEGVALGVGFGGAETLALAITVAIAVHNIPEGLAVTAVLRPQGRSLIECAGWSVFSSLPQPLLAVPAFVFVEVFQAALPYGLGFAAGAMAFLVLQELLPEAYGHAPASGVAFLVTVSLVTMVLFQRSL